MDINDKKLAKFIYQLLNKGLRAIDSNEGKNYRVQMLIST